MARSVLVVDDIPDVLDLIRMHLEAAGWEVHTRGTAVGLEGVIEAEGPDLVICDLCLPDRDAVEFFRARAARPLTDPVRYTPVVLISAHGLVEDALDESMDVAAVLRKPMRMTELEGVLDRVMSERAGRKSG
jgi:two-component system alkaline phosphatase synthesis response regulator PhoP